MFQRSGAARKSQKATSRALRAGADFESSSYLQHHKVRAPTKLLYTTAADEFKAWASERQLPLRQQSQRDAAMNDYVNMITRTSMQLKDSWYDTGSEEAETGFYKEVTPKRDMPYDEPFQNAITFEMTLDQKEYFR